MSNADKIRQAYVAQARTVQDDLYFMANDDPAVARIDRMLVRGGWRARLAKLTPTYIAEYGDE